MNPIIRAAEGVVLEPGEYEVVEVDDLFPNLKPGDIARPERLDAVRRLATAYDNRYGWLFVDGGPSTWLTAVRRIEAASAPVVETACNCDESKRLAAELERTRTERGEFWRESLRLDAELQCARSTEIRLREGLGRERDELWHEIVELRQNRDKYRLSDDRHMAELVDGREVVKSETLLVMCEFVGIEPSLARKLVSLVEYVERLESETLLAPAGGLE